MDNPPTRRFRSPVDLALFVGALRLFRTASSVRSLPISETLYELTQRWTAVRTDSARRAVAACQRAGPRAARWLKTLDTCLTRSMVAATMISPRSCVHLAIGFRPSSDDAPVDGHAWIIVAGKSFQLSTPPDLDTRPYSCLAEIPLVSRPDIAILQENTTRRRLSDGTGITLDLDRSTIATCNPSATILLEAIDRGVHGIGPLASVITSQFDVDEGTARRDVEAFLAELSCR